MQVGTIWIWSGYIVIALGLFIGSLIVHHGTSLNQQISEKK